MYDYNCYATQGTEEKTVIYIMNMAKDTDAYGEDGAFLIGRQADDFLGKISKVYDQLMEEAGITNIDDLPNDWIEDSRAQSIMHKYVELFRKEQNT